MANPPCTFFLLKDNPFQDNSADSDVMLYFVYADGSNHCAANERQIVFISWKLQYSILNRLYPLSSSTWKLFGSCYCYLSFVVAVQKDSPKVHLIMLVPIKWCALCQMKSSMYSMTWWLYAGINTVIREVLY